MLQRFAFTCVCVAALAAAQEYVPLPRTAADAERLEISLKDNPNQAGAHRALAIYYYNAGRTDAARVREPRREHILWMIEHRPEDHFHRDAFSALVPAGQALADPDGWKLAAAAWRRHFTGEAPPAAVFTNAVRFFELSDPAYARKLATEGLSRYPGNREIAAARGRLLALAMLGAKGLEIGDRVSAFDDAAAQSDDAKAARRELEGSDNPGILIGAGDLLGKQELAMRMRGREEQGAAVWRFAENCLRRAFALDRENPRAAMALQAVYQGAAASKRDPAQRLALLEKAAAVPADERFAAYLLSDLARAQFDAGVIDKAAATATALLDNAARWPDGGNHGGAVHWGNIVLGRIALKQGNAAEAARRLLAAGRTEGSPALNSFGPDWQLAKDLLNAGQREPVLEYIALCRKFWELGRGAMDRWEAAMREGAVPSFVRTGPGSGRDETIAKLAGKPAPELRLKNLAGQTVSLADYKGKLVLIDFWATWCAPCRKEMPVFEKLHREFGGKDVVVLTVDADEPGAAPAEYMKDEKFTFPVLLAEGTDTVKRWGVAAFPTTVVVDAEGRVAAFAVGGRSEAELRELIAKARK